MPRKVNGFGPDVCHRRIVKAAGGKYKSKKEGGQMNVSRREFIQITGATAAGLAVSGLGFDLSPVKSHAQTLKIKDAKETTTICCYCGVGCGAIVHSSKQGDGRTISIEGDPDHVISRGALCSKGASLKQLAESKNRLLKPMYRAKNAKDWKEVTWEG